MARGPGAFHHIERGTTMRRAPHLIWLVSVVTAAAGLAYHSAADGARQGSPRRQADAAPATLPLAQVVLFNSGVGYFQREGMVEGDARIDLAFPADDINDLLKSLVLQDSERGSVTAVSYDSHEPIERTLNSFALDLTGNPSFGQILNQARGEKVEVSVQDGGVNSTIDGQIVGMESQTDSPGKEVHLLNLICSDGLRSIPSTRVQRIRFLNPALDAELDGALRVLAAAHDTKKKVVHLQFKGTDKRSVRVGYVVESPIWKTTYRLVFDKDGKPMLQCWAVIENTTDEDWKDVRLALVSGRPLSFSMDLYQPLFVPRPKVEPELFASLRPPAYSGALLNGAARVGGIAGNQPGMQIGAFGAVGALGSGGLTGGGLTGGVAGSANFGIAGVPYGIGGSGQLGASGAINRYQTSGFQDGIARGQDPTDDENTAVQPGKRLTYEELLKRRQEQKKARQEALRLSSTLAAVDPKESLDDESDDNAGQAFEYILDQNLSLKRQKSALVQIINKEVQSKRVSIFNEAVLSRVPLLGLRFKNTTGKPLMQGPLIVYEAGRYAGDSRILDLQPDEERLLAFALDQGVEVKTLERQSTGPRVAVRVLQNELQVGYTFRKTQTYVLRNRSNADRQMVIEHPWERGWTLAAENKPAELSRDHYRFEISVPAGKATNFEVAEEQPRSDPFPQPDRTFKEEDQLVRHFAIGNAGLEFEIATRLESAELIGLKIAGGEVTSLYQQLDKLTYRVRNASQMEREVSLEHQTPPTHKLVGDNKPIPGFTDRYLFNFKLAPGKEVERTVQDLGRASRTIKLAALDDEQARSLLASAAVNENAKSILREAVKQRSELEKVGKAAEEARAALKGIADEQVRLRANLERLPAASVAYKRYLEKFDSQETQIEKLQMQLSEADKAFKRQQKENSDFVTRATAE
jgi:hypothetical protein